MVLNRFGLRLFPLPLAGVPGQRIAKRLRPQARIGANRRKAAALRRR